jgi:hypothetical protein
VEGRAGKRRGGKERGGEGGEREDREEMEGEKERTEQEREREETPFGSAIFEREKALLQGPTPSLFFVTFDCSCPWSL